MCDFSIGAQPLVKQMNDSRHRRIKAHEHRQFGTCSFEHSGVRVAEIDGFVLIAP
jgi:hypothetical protein